MASKVEKIKKKLFKELIKEIFKNNPRIETIAWAQFTPYFTQTFGVYFDYYLWINEERDHSSKRFLPEKFSEIKEYLSFLSPEFYKSRFGDHVKVIIDRNLNVTTITYDYLMENDDL